MHESIRNLIEDGRRYSPYERETLAKECATYFAGYSHSRHEINQCLGLIDVLISKNLIAKSDNRLADALAVAVEALEVMTRNGISDDIAPTALTKIQRIAEGKDDD